MILFVPAVISVADLEIQKGGFSLVSRSQTLTGSLEESGYARLGSAIGARSALANLGVATPTFGHAGSPN